jgi:hypothetical protein
MFIRFLIKKELWYYRDQKSSDFFVLLKMIFELAKLASPSLGSEIVALCEKTSENQVKIIFDWLKNDFSSKIVRIFLMPTVLKNMGFPLL